MDYCVFLPLNCIFFLNNCINGTLKYFKIVSISILSNTSFCILVFGKELINGDTRLQIPPIEAFLRGFYKKGLLISY